MRHAANDVAADNYEYRDGGTEMEIGREMAEREERDRRGGEGDGDRERKEKEDRLL